MLLGKKQNILYCPTSVLLVGPCLIGRSVRDYAATTSTRTSCVKKRSVMLMIYIAFHFLISEKMIYTHVLLGLDVEKLIHLLFRRTSFHSTQQS